MRKTITDAIKKLYTYTGSDAPSEATIVQALKFVQGLSDDLLPYTTALNGKKGIILAWQGKGYSIIVLFFNLELCLIRNLKGQTEFERYYQTPTPELSEAMIDAIRDTVQRVGEV